MPELLSQLERDSIVKCFEALLRTRAIKTNHFDITLPDRPTMFVKYGNSDILAEASTQSFFYALAQGDSKAPGIPRVYGAFRGAGRYFLVMEKIDKPTLAACDSIEDAYAVELVAFAVGWLLGQMPRIPASVFGRISAEKACVWHRFFKDHRAPLTFANSGAVMKYVNKVWRSHLIVSSLTISPAGVFAPPKLCKTNFYLLLGRALHLSLGHLQG